MLNISNHFNIDATTFVCWCYVKTGPRMQPEKLLCRWMPPCQSSVLLCFLPSHVPSSGYRDQGLPQDVWWGARSRLLQSHAVCVVWTTPKAWRWSLPLWWPDTANAWMMGGEPTSEGNKCRKKERKDGKEAAGCRMMKMFMFIFWYLVVL